MFRKTVAIAASLVKLGYAAGPLMTNPLDPSSYSNTQDLYTTHFELDVEVDFTNSSLMGTNTLSLNVISRTTQLVLDTMDMTIKSVKDKDGNPLAFETQQPNPNLGSVLIVYFTHALESGDQTKVVVEYATGKNATGMNWLNKDQTYNKKLNYLFTQCEPIYCRSIAPLQDTPSVKYPYTAFVTVPNGYKAFMSAESTGSSAIGKDKTRYSFDMKIPIASYVLALAVGDLGKESVGSNATTGTTTGVISETGDMLALTKKIYGDPKYGIQNALDRMEAYLTPYIYKDYNLLVLPPTFPYGGMENPLLTFASPTTIMTEDTSQTYVATHEIAHSWTGNEVTCQNWSNMWLNEGFTVFEERKITGMQHSEEFSKVEMLLGTYDLQDSFDKFGPTNTFSSLNPQFNGANPDDSFSEVPYEKGFQLLYYMEALMNEGKKSDYFQEFLREWILANKEKSATQDQLHQFWLTFIAAQGRYSTQEQADLIKAVNWEEWMNTPGPAPKVAEPYLNFGTAASVEALGLANDYAELQGGSPYNLRGYNTWYPNKQVLFVDFLQDLADKGELTLLTLLAIDNDLKITDSVQPEVKQRWFPLGIQQHYEPVFAPAKKFVSEQGRMKYLNPIYTALVQNGYRSMAYEWYKENEAFYHPIARATLKRILLMSLSHEDEMALQKHEKTKAFLRE